ncbi:hypothetical protein [Cryptosporangium aurantiacum]|uniref:Cytochrome P450 n=1 Tax=Cryptosporangium aurantiacum TaxID=134849 RepID=A0A1M7RNC9_9ACTN|nr:hypothetical protein [Cryptosporangium aurantiacum]SHN47711.1 hypothetical protein SAMN05443668_12714 [Cryptosporangium aurantiacum]
MQQIPSGEAASVLTDPAFVVPPVPPATGGVAWLRATVARFSTGEDHARRRALAVGMLAAVPPDSLRGAYRGHPVDVLARALGIAAPVVELVDYVAQAYQPGTGDETRADAALPRLVEACGGAYDETTAARIGLLVQACRATADLIDRSRTAPVEEVLQNRPPVPMTKRQALVGGDLVSVPLAGDLAFGAGPHRCPGRAHALALVDGALRGPNRTRPAS